MIVRISECGNTSEEQCNGILWHEQALFSLLSLLEKATISYSRGRVALHLLVLVLLRDEGGEEIVEAGRGSWPNHFQL
jgi:hypothetical protein